MSTFTREELRSALALSSVVGLRMFGLFLILPVFTVYADKLPGATPFMIGLAIGIYGLGQAALQIPMGLLSDRMGRKPTITLGLAVFAAGSLLAALSHGLAGIVLGRALQGMGAVSGASQALAADLSAEENRSKMMGIIGVSIGLAFVLALILGPPLAAIAGLPGLFGCIMLLALAAMAMLWLLVPDPGRVRMPRAAGAAAVMRQLGDSRLLVLNVSVFFMHALLTAAFVALPLLLQHRMDIPPTRQWEIYLPVMLVSALVMGMTLRRLSSVSQSLRMALACAVALGLALLGFAFAGTDAALLVLAATVFFSAFNLLEAALPSLVSRMAAGHLRGAALGAYSTCQFLGAFIGGVLGGYALGHFGLRGVFIAAALLILPWLPMLAWGMRRMVGEETARASQV